MNEQQIYDIIYAMFTLLVLAGVVSIYFIRNLRNVHRAQVILTHLCFITAGLSILAGSIIGLVCYPFLGYLYHRDSKKSKELMKEIDNFVDKLFEEQIRMKKWKEDSTIPPKEDEEKKEKEEKEK